MNLKNSMIYSVSQVNKYVKGLLENDVFLSEVFIEAEISNFTRHSSGHLYFTLKDNDAAINALMFRSASDKLLFEPENGMKIVAFGYISLYPKSGQIQFYVSIMEPAGRGSLHEAYEQLKQRLEKAGLFDQKHKKPIEKYPKSIGVITSENGAAIRDIINVAGRRNSNVKIVIVPVLVQGASAAEDIARGIETMNRYGKVDTIILGRGGGSIEDLWAFNEEVVARAIFESVIPIISAVGHETDFTISDFISDLRAPTPSAAAEIAVPDVTNIETRLNSSVSLLLQTINRKIDDVHSTLNYAINSYSIKRFPDEINNSQIHLENLVKRLNKDFINNINISKHHLSSNYDKLCAISPLNILQRGFSLVYDKKGALISDTENVTIGDEITIKFNKGNLNASVINKE